MIGASQALEIVERADWGARPPKEVIKIGHPVHYVVIHHTYIPGSCETSNECKADMRSMQRFHQDDHGWCDIGYAFAVGGDGKVYKGRGFDVVGAHSPRYNDKSVGIALIGDWTGKTFLRKSNEIRSTFN